MRSAFSCITVAAVLLAGAAAGRADIVPRVGDKMYFTDYKSGQLGGSLLANPVSPSNFTPFRTFCVEIEQFVWVGGGSNFQYQIADIGTVTVSGGKSLTPKAAWLYTQYRNGTLSGYGDATALDRNVLQYAIWNAIGYTDAQLISRFGSGFRTIIANKNARTWDADYAASGWTGLGRVRIANMVWGNWHQGHGPGYEAQDQLIMQNVPAPAAAVLGIVGLGLASLLKRRLS